MKMKNIYFDYRNLIQIKINNNKVMRSRQSENLTSQKEKKFIDTAKSENGTSANLSQGSNGQNDEEFSVEKGEKFEFINENIKDWPQWSVNPQKQQKQRSVEVEEKVETQVQYVEDDDEYMYNRGLYWRKRTGQKFHAGLEKFVSKKENILVSVFEKMKSWVK